ncbi:uncharacterized protein [Pyxicephalus adspersus]
MAPPFPSNPGREDGGVQCSMAAEKTPSRRKQCIFHRTFLRLPFGRCERRNRGNSNSSYDVHHIEATQPAEKWSPKDSSITSLGLHQLHPREDMESDGGSRTHMPNIEPANSLNGAQGDDVVLKPVLVNSHQADLGFVPQISTGHQNIDFEVSLDDLGQQEVDSAYSSVSHIEEESLHQMVSPPSPSVSSMETDMGVDPETGERALE